MEQANDIATVWINAGNIRTLEPIAVYASKGKIIGSVNPAVLPRDNVIDLEWRWVKC